jgi:hypothetical protein
MRRRGSTNSAIGLKNSRMYSRSKSYVGSTVPKIRNIGGGSLVRKAQIGKGYVQSLRDHNYVSLLVFLSAVSDKVYGLPRNLYLIFSCIVSPATKPALPVLACTLCT